MHRHTYTEIHDRHTYIGFCARGNVMYSVCVNVRSGFQFPAGTIFVLLHLLAFVGGTGSRYGRLYSVQSIRTLDHLSDRAIEHVELNFSVSVSNSRRAAPTRFADASRVYCRRSSANCIARDIVAKVSYCSRQRWRECIYITTCRVLKNNYISMMNPINI